MTALNTMKSEVVVGLGISIPTEITEEILAKLAVKSLSRFRCVSKSWLSLIDSKTFINKHLRNSETNRSPLIDGNSMIFFNKHLPSSNELSESLISKFNEQEFGKELLSLWRRCQEPATGSILGCFNGVLCFIERGRFFFYNPAIRISNELPESEIFKTPCFVKDLGVLCDRVNQEIRCGFGWDEETDDAYKVFVCVFDPHRECVGKVYSSKTNSWKTVECGGIGHSRMFGHYNVGVFAYGKLHWISESDEHSRIEYFDLKSEVFGTVDLPSRPTGGGVWSLRESRGCLYALYRANNDDDDDDDDGDDDVWVMET